MTEHHHVWTHNGFDYEDGAECADPDCKEWLGTEEITLRLNASERSSAEIRKVLDNGDLLDKVKLGMIYGILNALPERLKMTSNGE